MRNVNYSKNGKLKMSLILKIGGLHKLLKVFRKFAPLKTKKITILPFFE